MGIHQAAKNFPASSAPQHLGRKVFTEFHMYSQQGDEKPVLRAEFAGRDQEMALNVLAAVNASRVTDEKYFLVRAQFEVIA